MTAGNLECTMELSQLSTWQVGESLFQVAQLVWRYFSAVLTAFIWLGKEWLSVSNQPQGLPESCELFTFWVIRSFQLHKMFDLRENVCTAMTIYTTPRYLAREFQVRIIDMRTSMFTAAQFIVTESWNQPWYSAAQQGKRICHVYTQWNFFLAIVKNQLMSFA